MTTEFNSRRFDAAQQARNRGDIARAIVGYGQMRVEALANGDLRQAAECWHMIGVAYYQDRQWVKAEDYLQKSLLEMREQGDQVGEGAVLRDLGMEEAGRGNYPPAGRYFRESVKVLQATSNLGHLGMSLVKWGVMMASTGHDGKAVEKIREGINKIEQSPDRAFQALAYEDLGQVLARQGKKAEALVELAKAEELFKALDNPEQFQPKLAEIKGLISRLKES